MSESPRKLLVIDSSYAWEDIRARGLEWSVTCRDLDGFFEHVWTVHPFASLVEKHTSKVGLPEEHTPHPAHTFIDGKIGRFAALAHFRALNFLIAQTTIFAQLTSLIRREKVSVIRAGDPLYAGLLGLALSRVCGIPLVIRVNANYDDVYRRTGKSMMPRLFPWRPLEQAVFKFVLARADLVAAVNNDNLDFALANGARQERSTLFRYGNLIDKRHVAAPETRDLSGADLREFWSAPRRFLLHVGRLEPSKCPENVIRTLAEVRRRGCDVDLLMVGDGRLRASLEALAGQLAVDNHVVFTGNRGQDWLSRVIPLASVVISPYTGRALTEAAFGAAPIVAYDLDWQSELITSGVTGELVPAGNWMKLAEAVERFLLDPVYARTMGDAVRKRAFEMLDPATLDQHERDQYERLLRRSGANDTPEPVGAVALQ